MMNITPWWHWEGHGFFIWLSLLSTVLFLLVEQIQLLVQRRRAEAAVEDASHEEPTP